MLYNQLNLNKMFRILIEVKNISTYSQSCLVCSSVYAFIYSVALAQKCFYL